MRFVVVDVARENKLRIEASIYQLALYGHTRFLFCISIDSSQLCVVHFKMGSVSKDFTALSRLIFAINTFGHVFVSLTQCSSVVKRFVYGQCPEEAGFKDEGDIEVSRSFAAETASLIEICPSLKESSNQDFKKFHDFSLFLLVLF